MKAQAPTIWLCTSIACLAANNSTLYAAEPSPNNGTMEEMVVTANKRPQNWLQADLSITQLKQATVEGLRPRRSDDIAQAVAGWHNINTGPRNSSPTTLRGLNVNNLSANDQGGNGGSVAVYFDNTSIPIHFTTNDLLLSDIHRVEVARGPQGTLYGASSMGGTIRYISNQPQFDSSFLRLGGEWSQTAHSDSGNWRSDLVANLPIHESMAIRASFSQLDDAGFIDNPHLIDGPQDDINDDQSHAGQIAWRWQPSEALDMTLRYQRQEQEVGDRQAANPSYTGDEYAIANRFLQPATSELEIFSGDLIYQFNDIELAVNASSYRDNTRDKTDSTDLLLTLYHDYFGAIENLTVDTHYTTNIEQDSVEIRLSSTNDSTITWLFGLYYRQLDINAETMEFAPGYAEANGVNRPDNLELYGIQREDVEETAAFAEVRFDITPNIELTTGLRSFILDNELYTGTSLPIDWFLEGSTTPSICFDSNDPNADLDCARGSETVEKTLFKLGANWQWHPQWSAYTKVAEGYRRGGTNVRSANSQPHETFYHADTVLNKEVGIHSQLFDKKLTLQAALYHIDWNNIQVLTGNPDGFSMIVNGNDARSQGLEVEAIWKIDNHWRLQTSYSHTDTQLTEDAHLLDAKAGDRAPGVPRNQWFLSADAEYPAFAGLQWQGQVNTTYVGGFLTNLNRNEFVQTNPAFGLSPNADARWIESYQLWNLSAGLKATHWQVQLFADNLTDKRAVTGVRGPLNYGERGQFEYINRPRTIGISGDYQF